MSTYYSIRNAGCVEHIKDKCPRSVTHNKILFMLQDFAVFYAITTTFYKSQY
jgi:hypothetical protein